VVRILAIIFKFDGEQVGGLIGYICRGWPFGTLHQIMPSEKIQADAGSPGVPRRKEAGKMIQGALEQVARKEFEPLDELLEIKMNFLFVTFFAPIMPIGLLPTLAARLLRVRSKATKLFFLRRRCWPHESNLLHQTQEHFNLIVANVTVVWYTGLVVVSYNPFISEWEAWKTLLVWFLAWVAVAGVLRFIRYAVSHRSKIFTKMHCSCCTGRRHKQSAQEDAIANGDEVTV